MRLTNSMTVQYFFKTTTASWLLDIHPDSIDLTAMDTSFSKEIHCASACNMRKTEGCNAFIISNDGSECQLATLDLTEHLWYKNGTLMEVYIDIYLD